MGYEDMDVDSRIKKYNYYKKYKFEVPNQSHSTSIKSTKSHSYSQEVNSHNVISPKTKKKKIKKNKCKKRFIFSKYHYMSKKPLYDYQKDSLRKGLINDAMNQMEYILNLMESCKNRAFINCKIEEINKFIKIHKLHEATVIERQKTLIDSFKKRSDKS